jgi:hypothetical protein
MSADGGDKGLGDGVGMKELRRVRHSPEFLFYIMGFNVKPGTRFLHQAWHPVFAPSLAPGFCTMPGTGFWYYAWHRVFALCLTPRQAQSFCSKAGTQFGTKRDTNLGLRLRN